MIRSFKDTCINLNDLIISPTGLCLTWIGVGVVDSCFNPSQAGAGTHQIDYIGCTDICYDNSFDINVGDGPSVTLNPFPDCHTDSVFNVDSYVVPNFYDSISWEIRYLPNPTPTVFYTVPFPGNVPVMQGLNEIRVTIFSDCGTNTAVDTIYIPEILQLGSVADQCSHVDTCINLNDLIISPAGLCLNWSGIGVSGNCFNPSIAGGGTHIITYQGCTDICYSDTIQIFVNDGSSNLQDMQVCVNSDSIILDNIQDGVWFGTGVVNDILYPNLAGDGVFDIAFQSNGNAPCFIRDTFQITIDSAVTALVSVNEPNCVDSIFTFENISIHSTLGWSFAPTSTNDVEARSYSTAGTYTEWLAVGNTTCIDTLYFDVIVEPLIIGDIAIDNISIECDGVTIDVSVANPDPSYNYIWEVDGQIATTVDTTLFAQGNIVDTLIHVNLTITNTCGILTLQDTVFVPAIFNAGFGALQTDTVCHGTPITFANISTGFIDSFTIDYGNGSTSTDILVDQIYYNHTDSIISYQLMLVIYSNQCGTDTAYQTIWVLPVDIEANGWIDGFDGCEPLARQFINYSTPGTIATFFFGNGVSTTGYQAGDTVYYTYPNAGIYYPYIVAVGCGIDTFYYNPVTVHELPDLGFFHPSQVCVRENITFVDTSNLASNLIWTIDGIEVQQLGNLDYTFDVAGTYTICMQGTHILTQCTDTVCSTITIVDNPSSFDGLIVTPTIGCMPLDVTVDLTIPYDSIRIDYGNGQVRYEPSTVLYDSVGTYLMKVRLFNANNCFIDTIITIEVLPSLTVVGYANPYTIGLGEETRLNVVANMPVSSIIWTSPNDSTRFDVFNFSDIPNSIGQNVYDVFVEAEHGCMGEDTILVTVFDERNVFIPNGFTPNRDGINDKFLPYSGKGVQQIRLFQLYDRWGNLVHQATNFQPNDEGFGWDGEHRGKPMEPGVYVYVVEVEFTDGEVIIYKGDVTLVR